MLKGEDGFQRKEFDKLLEWLAAEPPPDVIQLPNALLASLRQAAAPRVEAADSLHAAGRGPVSRWARMPADRDDGDRADPRALSRSSIGSPRSASTTRRSCRRICPFRCEKIDVVPLGINLDGLRTGTPAASRPFTIGYLAQDRAREGVARAVRRLRAISAAAGRRQRPTRGGGISRARPAGVPARCGERVSTVAGLGGGVSLSRRCSNREQKIEFLRNLDVFSVPTVYVEPKGLFLLEAMACGVPVVQPSHGAFPEILAKTSGGLLVGSGKRRQPGRGTFHAVDGSGAARRSSGSRDSTACGGTTALRAPPIAMLEVYQRWRC